MREKNPPGPLSEWSEHVPPRSAWVFSRDSGSLPRPQKCARSMNWHVSIVTVRASVRVCDLALGWRVACLGWGASLAPWAAGRGSSHPGPWTGNSGIENNDLTCFCSSFLNVCTAHIHVSVLTLEVFWVFTWNFGDVSITRNPMP